MIMTRRNGIWAVAAILALALGWFGGQQLPDQSGQRSFQLSDTQGNLVDSSTALAGQGFLVFFGYTFCPDVCPTTMAYLSTVLEAQRDQRGEIAPAFFVSVDPQRDTPERLDQYTGYFGDSIAGLTGTDEQLKTVAQSFSVYFEKVDGLTEDDYLIDHSSGILVLNSEHQLIDVIRDGEPLESALTKAAKAL